ncbi:MAG: bifunctional UDP-N-acetylmuramoyl-tripeptide:D-alanyl-D-alanine ligase/alanine racemase [Bacteroidia bacterium]|nr:bifunctional UDP-N-acetylmuramoyl-tripeptide:D-alanyl-D-alanine ligase/alanine racemase [Bacteroidia bacterium]
MPNYNIVEISKIINGKLTGDVNPGIRYLLIDSRTLFSPEESLFFAIVGERHDGHNFIQELFNKGVRNFVVSSLPVNSDEYADCNFILVENTLKALQGICAYHRKKFKIPVIGITGSNGKTIVKEWLYQLLSQDKNIARSPKSFNSQVGVPLSVWLLDDKTELAIFEAGISKENEMKNLQAILKPTIGVFTNIGDAHQENFFDQKQKAREKLKLFSECEKLVYCKDYYIIDDLIKQDKRFENLVFSWSLKYPADLYIMIIRKDKTESVITGKYKQKEIKITIPFTDDASIENAIHCWAMMLYLTYPNDEIQLRMQKLSPVAMRLELKAGINNCTLINDYYNSDLNSLNIALDFLNQQHQHAKKTLILSDILQIGADIKKLYHDVAELIKKKNIYQVIGIGPAITKQATSFTIRKKFFASTNEFLNSISNLQFRDEAILLKGARLFEFEKISEVLQQKTHNTVLEINLNALVHNLNFFRSLLKPGAKIMAMVKAFSYGSGMYEIANVLQYQKVDYLAVAYIDEGVELRKAGISVPILVMDPESHGFELMLEYNMEPELYSFKILNAFIDALKRAGMKGFPIHLKLDTGMRRLGFLKDDITSLIELIKDNQYLTVKSVFSHLVASDEPVHDKFTRLQFRRFEDFSNRILKVLDYPVLRHILNSSGIERFPDSQYDMVRLGIGLYGVSAINRNKLENVSALKTCISQIKKITASDTVGYSRNGQLRKSSVIATIPVGYADGLDRRLGNGVGRVMVKGWFAPIVGNICMDMCMIDITNVDAAEGDEVIVFGDNYRISELAEQMGTIPYEVLTSISRRVKRVYFHE